MAAQVDKISRLFLLSPARANAAPTGSSGAAARDCATAPVECTTPDAREPSVTGRLQTGLASGKGPTTRAASKLCRTVKRGAGRLCPCQLSIWFSGCL
ncbi:hypothetical protein BKA56DRAFT_347381 [Ilyonectria sp. MPI-CAGE-AT-0026]|nr:hypothetical protein BKA56DRAFT_347381 [Ilyonectria sp. MPI-CAGE-AT-0026]